MWHQGSEMYVQTMKIVTLRRGEGEFSLTSNDVSLQISVWNAP